jgi:hypothetical protein
VANELPELIPTEKGKNRQFLTIMIVFAILVIVGLFLWGIIALTAGTKAPTSPLPTGTPSANP